MEYSKIDSYGAKSQLNIKGKKYSYFDISKVAEKLGFDVSALPYTIRILLENLLRHEDGKVVKKGDLLSIKMWLDNSSSTDEIQYHPARVLMQDFTGVPAVVDLAAMRDACKELGSDPEAINPKIPVDLVIDHSVQVDEYATSLAFERNVEIEMERNKERYEFLKWGQSSFSNFRVVPPGTGICHQVNLEYLSKVVWSSEQNGETFAYPDTLVGTDSHTTMVNGLAVLGWGVGGIEAEASMLGQPMSMILPEVIGFKLTGKLSEGATATDLVLKVTNMLRKKGVVGKFVEFFGSGLNNLPLADRATIGNMAPEYGATCGFFPVDDETIKYMSLTGRDDAEIELVKEYSKKNYLWRNEKDQIKYTDVLELDLSDVIPAVAGPKRPQDIVDLKELQKSFHETLPQLNLNQANVGVSYDVEGSYSLKNGDVVIAAITSCTNTSNPSVMIGAGLIAKRARELGIEPKPWVKTSLAPGSKVVTEYFKKSGLQADLDALGFNLVGYGCTTCIGNSGPLKPEIEEVITENKLVVASVLSGNRNFEGRVHPLVRANYLASPMLCVIYAITGTVNIDIFNSPIAQDKNGNDVYLKDLWPSNVEIADYVNKSVDSSMFKKKYSDVFSGEESWRELNTSKGTTYSWSNSSTYIKKPPYFIGIKNQVADIDIQDAKLLALFGDSITTDHISPAGNISKNSPAADYLTANGVKINEFNSYGARRGNHEVMMRGTFANVRIKNELTPEIEGGYTRVEGIDEPITIYDAAMYYKKQNVPSIVIAGKEYGTGSSRDWAAKGPNLQGVKAVIAESFERIHRSNLVGMGIIPMVFTNNMTKNDLNLTGKESFSFESLDSLEPGKLVRCNINYANGEKKSVELKLRIDTEIEVEYIKNGGILQYVLKKTA